MPLWLSNPVVIFPPETGRGRDGRFDFFLENAAAIYGKPPPEFANLADHVDTAHPEAETLTAAAMRIALLEAPTEMSPTLLHDCRSTPTIGSPAPSYKLLSKAGLERTIPLTLHGQGGTEVIQALLLRLCEDDNAPSLTVLSATHWPLESTNTLNCDSLSANTAALVTTEKLLNGGFRLLGAALTRHYLAHSQVAISRVLAEALEFADIDSDQLGWAVIHNGVEGLFENVTTHLPTVQIFHRNTCAGIDLGCADILVSLHEFIKKLPTGVPGAIFAAGRFGAIAVLLTILER